MDSMSSSCEADRAIPHALPSVRRLAHVRWQDRKPDTELLQICNMTGIEAFLIKTQFRWTGLATWCA